MRPYRALSELTALNDVSNLLAHRLRLVHDLRAGKVAAPRSVRCIPLDLDLGAGESMLIGVYDGVSKTPPFRDVCGSTLSDVQRHF